MHIYVVKVAAVDVLNFMGEGLALFYVAVARVYNNGVYRLGLLWRTLSRGTVNPDTGQLYSTAFISFHTVDQIPHKLDVFLS